MRRKEMYESVQLLKARVEALERRNEKADATEAALQRLGSGAEQPTTCARVNANGTFTTWLNTVQSWLLDNNGFYWPRPTEVREHEFTAPTLAAALKKTRASIEKAAFDADVKRLADQLTGSIPS